MRECGGHLFIRRGLSRLLDCLSIVHVVSLGLLVARALLRQPFRQRSPPPGDIDLRHERGRGICWAGSRRLVFGESARLANRSLEAWFEGCRQAAQGSGIAGCLSYRSARGIGLVARLAGLLVMYPLSCPVDETAFSSDSRN